MSTDDGGFGGRAALVTGAAGGLGRAICAELAAGGAKVAGVDRIAPDGDGPAGKTEMLGLRADAADEAQIASAVEEAARAHGPATLVVCAAGAVSEAPVEDLALDEWRRIVDASLTSAFLTMRAVVPAMRAAGGGAIVALSSGYGRKGYPRGAHYAAAKAGVEALVKSLALEVAADGIRVNAVAPGPFETPMIDHLGPERRAAVSAAIPQGRIGDVHDVTGPVLFLLSSAAGHMTGQVVHVNGGLLMP